jgi:hypothetical protein
MRRHVGAENGSEGGIDRDPREGFPALQWGYPHEHVSPVLPTEIGELGWRRRVLNPERRLQLGSGRGPGDLRQRKALRADRKQGGINGREAGDGGDHDASRGTDRAVLHPDGAATMDKRTMDLTQLTQVQSQRSTSRGRGLPGLLGEILAFFSDGGACLDYLEFLAWPTGFPLPGLRGANRLVDGERPMGVCRVHPSDVRHGWNSLLPRSHPPDAVYRRVVPHEPAGRRVSRGLGSYENASTMLPRFCTGWSARPGNALRRHRGRRDRHRGVTRQAWTRAEGKTLVSIAEEHKTGRAWPMSAPTIADTTDPPLQRSLADNLGPASVTIGDGLNVRPHRHLIGLRPQARQSISSARVCPPRAAPRRAPHRLPGGALAGPTRAEAGSEAREPLGLPLPHLQPVIDKTPIVTRHEFR